MAKLLKKLVTNERMFITSIEGALVCIVGRVSGGIEKLGGH
jgi:hypothetical protein